MASRWVSLGLLLPFTAVACGGPIILDSATDDATGDSSGSETAAESSGDSGGSTSDDGDGSDGTTGDGDGDGTTGDGDGDGSTTSSSTSGDGDGDGTTGFNPCDGFSELTVDNAFAVSNSTSSFVWEPGTQGVVGADLGTTNPMGFFAYPGIRVTSDNPLVTSTMNENWLFGVDFGAPMQLEVAMDADPTLPAGSVVTFTIEAVALNQSCGQGASAMVSVTIG